MNARRTLAIFFFALFFLSAVGLGQQPRSFRSNHGRLYDFAISANGRSIVTVSREGIGVLWDIEDSEQKLTWQCAGARSVAISPDGRTLVTRSSNKLQFWDAATGVQLRELIIDDQHLRSIVFSPDNRYLAAGGHEIWIVDIASGAVLQLGSVSKEHEQACGLYFLPDDTLGVCSTKGIVYFWSITEAKELSERRLQTKRPIFRQQSKPPSVLEVTQTALAPDASLLAVATSDYRIEVWDVQKKYWHLWNTLKGHEAPIRTLDISSDGQMLASAGNGFSLTLGIGSGKKGRHANFDYDRDDSLRIWNLQTGEQLVALKVEGGAIGEVKFTPDSKFLACDTKQGELQVWKLQELLDEMPLAAP